jgi:hypothetical protein
MRGEQQFIVDGLMSSDANEVMIMGLAKFCSDIAK